MLPTVVENAPPTARVYREEVFGPVVTITPFDTDDEAVAQANDTRYGLNAMVFTQNLSRAHRISAALKAGPSGSTASSSATCALPSAASATPVSAAKAATSAASSSPSPRPSSCRSDLQLSV